MRAPVFRILIACLLAALVAGCAGSQRPQADQSQIVSRSYRDPGPATLTLYTMINTRTGSGAHTSLMISGSERVIFDPAGSFRADVVPIKNDVLYGITPNAERAYRSSHARETHYARIQTVEVSPQQAEIALQLAKQMGPVAGVFCANSTSQLLQQVPGFEQIKTTFYPVKLSDQFGQIPGVVTTEYRENDSADLQQGLAENNARLNQLEAASAN
ncbi:lipoprotein, putative [Rhodobacteraceae bacterium KLH11]|nr:lipoprotein, putative [Rhodobacteraceae bacterium KLH11]